MRKALCGLLASAALTATLFSGLTAYAQTDGQSANLKVEVVSSGLPVSDYFTKISGDLIVVYQDGKYGYADMNEDIVIPCKYKKAWPFVTLIKEIGLVLGQDDKYYTVDISGTEKPLTYNGKQLDINSDLQPQGLCDNGLISLAPKEVYPKTCYINSDGKTVLPLDYYDLSGFGGSNFHLLSSVGVYDNTGDLITEWDDGMLIDLGQAIGHASISDGLIPFYIKSEDGMYKYGYADIDGNVIIRPEYDGAMPFSNGYAVVQKDGKDFAIDTENKKCTSDFSLNELQFGNVAGCFVTYDKLLAENGETLYTCEKGMTFAVINCVYGMQNKNINPVYIIQNDDNKRGATDKYGNRLIPAEYDYINLFVDGYSTGVKDGELYVFRLISTPVDNPQPASTDGILYTNHKLGVSLTLPASWKGAYDIEEGADSVSFLHKASEGNNGGGFLFAIARHDGMWTPDTMNRGANSFSMMTDKYTYTFIRATGVEYTDASEDEYKKMEADIPSVKKTTKSIAVTGDADPTFNSNAQKNEQDLQSSYIYGFANGDVLNPQVTTPLLLLNGSFSTQATGMSKYFAVYVPLGDLVKAFGGTSSWDASKKEAVFKLNDLTIDVIINEYNIAGSATLNGIACEEPNFEHDKCYVTIGFINKYMNLDAGFLNIPGEMIAKNPVILVDRPGTYKLYDKAGSETLDWLKTQLYQGLDNFKAATAQSKTPEMAKEVAQQIANDIKNTNYLGQAGRYALYDGAGKIILVNTETKDIYFYEVEKAYGNLTKIDINDPNLYSMKHLFE